MRRTIWLAVILLFVVVLLMVGCTGHPEGMKSLRWRTDTEKDKVIEIALGTPEAMEVGEEYGIYEINLNGVAIKWLQDHPSELRGLDYEVVDKIPDRVPGSTEYYSRVELYFGERPRILLRVAVNPDTGEVVHVECHGLKTVPAASPPVSPSSVEVD